MDETERTRQLKRQPWATFFNGINLVLAFVLFIGNHATEAVTRPREFFDSRTEVIGSRYCDFSTSERIYNITDLLLCMDELASTAVAHSRVSRSSEDRDYFVPTSRRVQPHALANHQYPRRQSNDYQGYYERRPVRFYSGPGSYQSGQPGYYDGGFKYPYPTEQSFGYPGGLGTGLFDALASISQYDDLKCVSRILCEVATGVTPGNPGYKQNYEGGNSLISLLTALDIGEPSPLLTFGKSALTGYTNRGNPNVCYREYPKCPRSNAELVNYLNNHNGGFFRFFGNVRGSNFQGNYYRGAPRRESAPPVEVSRSESDRTGTGELKFDSGTGLISREFMKTFFPERRAVNDSDKVTFSQEPLQGAQSLNRVSKSLLGYQDTQSEYQNPSFFPQDRKDSETNMLYSSSPLMQPDSRPRLSRMMESRRAKLYLPDDPTNETISTFTFPDGQKVRINVAFSKLFSGSYKKALRRSFGNDHEPEPVNFEGFSMINLAELYPNDGTRLELQVVHPCDMICHDAKAATVQFAQILLHSGSLSTLMSPDQPILDLSVAIPCEVICIDRGGERRQISTTLNQVLRTGYERQSALDMMAFQDDWQNRNYRSLSPRRHARNSKNHKDRETIKPSQRRLEHSEKQESHIRSRGVRQSENKQSIVNAGDKGASVPQASVLFGNGPMPFFGAPISLMGVAEFPHGPSSFFPQESTGQLGLAVQSMPISMQPNTGVIQSLRMMPIFPGLIPIMEPITGGSLPIIPVSPPPTIICSNPGCPAEQQTPQRILMLCGGILYFIPYEFVLPFCAINLDNTTSTKPEINQESEWEPSAFPFPEQILSTTSASVESLQQFSTTANKFQPEVNVHPDLTQTTPDVTTHKFRPPEGVDYPQESCLEGESWSLDTHECVPIKYDPDIESDYVHLPGSPWSAVTKKPAHSRRLKKKKKKLVIITDKGNITYIKAA